MFVRSPWFQAAEVEGLDADSEEVQDVPGVAQDAWLDEVPFTPVESEAEAEAEAEDEFPLADLGAEAEAEEEPYVDEFPLADLEAEAEADADPPVGEDRRAGHVLFLNVSFVFTVL